MTIHNLYLFDRDGQLLYYTDWNRKKQSGMSREEEAKLMYGMIFSIKSFVAKVSPVDLKEGYLSYTTNKYRLNLYETPSRLKFILNTDIHAQGIKELLQQIYTQVYVEYVVYNPLCSLKKPIESELFAAKLDEVVKQSPAYASRPA
ncbi:trafficking protein particle complex subunit 1 [Penaeus vannamei]|uniref:trafficking protein particle complex subunit 1 n=1 Tax=Penaeus vannamei TaxID=6689 RepID=UPI000F65F120|nr:trafficking protein particle complex subunit 1-like [Penaeus vannamei]